MQCEVGRGRPQHLQPLSRQGYPKSDFLLKKSANLKLKTLRLATRCHQGQGAASWSCQSPEQMEEAWQQLGGAVHSWQQHIKVLKEHWDGSSTIHHFFLWKARKKRKRKWVEKMLTNAGLDPLGRGKKVIETLVQLAGILFINHRRSYAHEVYVHLSSQVLDHKGLSCLNKPSKSCGTFGFVKTKTKIKEEEPAPEGPKTRAATGLEK